MDDHAAEAFATGLQELNDENDRLRARGRAIERQCRMLREQRDAARAENERLRGALGLIGQFLGDVDGEPFYPDEYARRVLADEPYRCLHHRGHHCCAHPECHRANGLTGMFREVVASNRYTPEHGINHRDPRDFV